MKLDLAKMETRSGIARRNDDADAVAEREFSDSVYGKDTPYGWQVEYATVDRITRDDLIAFYKRYYFPANIMLAVYGDFDTAEMKTKLENLFHSWTYQQPPVPPFPRRSVPRRTRECSSRSRKTSTRRSSTWGASAANCVARTIRRST